MDFRTRLEQGKQGHTNNTLSPEPDDSFCSDYFAVERVKSLPVCLDLRLSNGAHKALPYSYFTEMNFSTETGIEIFTSGKRIKITGRNLSKLFDYLVAYRVRYIQANVGNDQPENGLFVKEIIIEEMTF